MNSRLQREQLTLIFTLLWSAASVSAYPMTGNQRLDRALTLENLVVAGRIVRIDREWRPPTTLWAPKPSHTRLEVQSVISGSASLKATQIVLSTTSFVWPKTLVPFKEGVSCILISTGKNRSKPNNEEYGIATVVPAHSHDFPQATNSEQIKRLLAKEILEELASEQSPKRQRHLILQVAPILNAEEARQLLPFLKNKDIWLKRAALAGIVYVMHEDRYLRMAVDDIKAFIATTKPDAFLEALDEPGERPQALGYLFTHYFFFSTGWSKEEDERNIAVLPLYRLVANTEELSAFQRWRYGIVPLCRSGTNEDLGTLYRWLEGKDGKAQDRQRLITGISRILNLGLPPGVSSAEAEQFNTIRKVFVERGLIPRDSPTTVRGNRRE